MEFEKLDEEAEKRIIAMLEEHLRHFDQLYATTAEILGKNPPSPTRQPAMEETKQETVPNATPENEILYSKHQHQNDWWES